MLPFLKYQGAGNDFVLVDARAGSRDWPALAQRVCRRHFGVGADGLLVVDSPAGVRMRMFNPDGTEDMCGNGLRCAAFYVHEQGLVDGQAFSIDTLAGPRACLIERVRGEEAVVTTAMGRASLDPRAIPMRVSEDRVVDYPLKLLGEEVVITALSTGTAHTVIFGEHPPEERFQRLSPAIERHELFPERTSVLWAQPGRDNRLHLRIWERAVGETLACGTGAAAAAVAATIHGLATSPVTVESRGGTLEVEVSKDLDVSLTGPAVRVFEGLLPLD